MFISQQSTILDYGIGLINSITIFIYKMLSLKPKFIMTWVKRLMVLSNLV